MTPELLPTRPPACRFAISGLPHCRAQTSWKFMPWTGISPALIAPTRPPNVVIPPAPAAPVTFPVANALVMVPLLRPRVPRRCR